MHIIGFDVASFVLGMIFGGFAMLALLFAYASMTTKDKKPTTDA